MAHLRLTDLLRDRAAMYVLRSLPEPDHDEFRSHLEGCPTCRHEVERLEATTAGLAPLVRPEPPPEGLFERVLDRIRSEPAAAPAARSLPAGLTVVLSGEGDWESGPVEGVELRVLHVDHAAGRQTLLARLAPGTSYPAHVHGGAEECYVLTGDLQLGEVSLGPGDYQRAEDGTVHGVQSTRGGCTLLITCSVSDRMLE